MKRILVISPSNQGTIALRSLTLYEAISKQPDVEAKLILVHKFKKGYPEFENCEFCTDKVSPVYKKIFAGVEQIIWLRKIKTQFKPDTTISNLFGCSTISVLSGGSDFKIGIFRSPHYSVINRGIIAYISAIFNLLFIYPHLDKLYCVSEFVRRSIVDNFHHIDKSKVETVYNNHDYIKVRKLGEEQLGQMEATIFSNPVVLFCGRLDNNKSPDRLLQAFIKANLPIDFQLVFIGYDQDNLWPALEKYAKNAGIAERVHYLGEKTNPYKYMKRSRVLVSSSYSEGLSGVIIESLILGRPVITTNSSMGAWETMMVADKYDPHFKGVLKTADGWITSNLAKFDKKDFDLDVEAMAQALTAIANGEEVELSFCFLEKIKSENIIQKYLI